MCATFSYGIVRVRVGVEHGDFGMCHALLAISAILENNQK